MTQGHGAGPSGPAPHLVLTVSDIAMCRHDAMRTIIELPDESVHALDRLRRSSGRSRAALVREAVERYLDANADSDRGAAFGAWRDLDADGLELQRRLRSELGETEP